MSLSKGKEAENKERRGDLTSEGGETERGGGGQGITSERKRSDGDRKRRWDVRVLLIMGGNHSQ